MPYTTETRIDRGDVLSLVGAKRDVERAAKELGYADRPVVSTEAVLTKATHLLSGLPGGRQACVDFFLSGGALLVPATTASLRRSRELLSQYADLPMDYADATLVVLAEEVGRALAPIPFSTSVYLATEALLLAGSTEQKRKYLPQLAAGEAVGTLALAEGVGRNGTATRIPNRYWNRVGSDEQSR